MKLTYAIDDPQSLNTEEVEACIRRSLRVIARAKAVHGRARRLLELSQARLRNRESGEGTLRRNR